MQQVIIGLDTAEMISEVELLGHSEIDFGIDELDDEDSDFHDEEDDDTENNNHGKVVTFPSIPPSSVRL